MTTRFDKMTVAQLKEEQKKRGISDSDIKGQGKNGAILKLDRVVALDKYEDTKEKMVGTTKAIKKTKPKAPSKKEASIKTSKVGQKATKKSKISATKKEVPKKATPVKKGSTTLKYYLTYLDTGESDEDLPMYYRFIIEAKNEKIALEKAKHELKDEDFEESDWKLVTVKEFKMIR